MIPGEIRTGKGSIEINKGRKTITLRVANSGDRPVQIGSHYHFAEVNRELVFDRKAAYGMRLDIAAGTAVRFEPGEEKIIELVEFGGSKAIYGLNQLTEGSLTTEETAFLKKVEAFARQGGEQT
ncbi:urease subunit beta [Alkalihalobacillus oceani]|uniref:urease subunit beta n=1 Tax=Halalkalibacter oceani TaxID=1653776 RepID=UPI00203AC573|nr:urease subunit beta [Halalkalibacter oceani]